MTEEAFKLAMEAFGEIEWSNNSQWQSDRAKVAITAIKKSLAEPEQEPVAYDKTELNCFAQDLYDQKMREGKRGHYESMFHVIHQCIKKVAPQPEQEPVAWWNDTGTHIDLNVSGRGTPLYTHPVKDLEDININITWNENSMRDFGKDELNFARAILRKAQEK